MIRFCNLHTHRNIIIVAGQNSIGKTTTFNTLVEHAKASGIPHEPQPYSDLFFLVDSIKADDRRGGLRHYHDWTSRREPGHHHSGEEPIIPFTVTDNEVVDDMFRDLFTALENAPSDRLIFVEWTGGRNVNPPEEPASRADFSFQRIRQLLQDGALPNAWLDRIAGVIHPVADTETRYALNDRKHSDSMEEIITGKVSPRKGSVVLDIFGEDDFSEITTLFTNRGIPIRTIHNDGSLRFAEQLQEVMGELFAPKLDEGKLHERSLEFPLKRRL